MEYHVRSARLTDVDAAMRVLAQSAADPEAGHDDPDLLRQLLYLPSATVVVAEVGRRLVGVGVLAIRPSVRLGAFVGVIDEFGVDPPGDAGPDGDTRLELEIGIIDHLVGSAKNKGCSRVEVSDPLASVEPRLWEAAGFAPRGAVLSRWIG